MPHTKIDVSGIIINMRDFSQRLSSRKFLLAVAAFLTAIANGEVVAAVSVVLAYIGVEGAADFKSRE